MELFARLFTQLDQTTKINAKVDALARYFAEASDQDKLWTIAILSHRRPKRTVTTTLLREWAAEAGNIPTWLFEESYHVVGDLAETIALSLPPATGTDKKDLSGWIQMIRELGPEEESVKKTAILHAWDQLDTPERFVFNKLITGGFRMGVSQKLMVRALSRYTNIEENILAHRLMGNWSPDTTTFEELILTSNPLDDISKPYPFYLAYPLEEEPEALGALDDWQAEHKWDGIRGQLIVREDQVFVWSRGEELVTDKYPEYAPLAKILPNGTVLDGEILPFKDGRPLPFQELQTRIGRKKVSAKLMEKVPVILMAYDLLEWQGEDVRDWPMEKRRATLEQITEEHPTGGILKLSEKVAATSWEELAQIREQARELDSEGLMLKRKDSPYQSGRKKGAWWKWKVDPYTVDAVMLYAQRGHGRRANLYTDYTFAVWDEDRLVPFTKAYSGLTDREFVQITQWVNRNTTDRFGPVRAVQPELVFEIAFEGINRSSRHKSGIAIRFPRMVRWRKDKPAKEANRLEDLMKLLPEKE
jgi:DNA ligase-1